MAVPPRIVRFLVLHRAQSMPHFFPISRVPEYKLPVDLLGRVHAIMSVPDSSQLFWTRVCGSLLSPQRRRRTCAFNAQRVELRVCEKVFETGGGIANSNGQRYIYFDRNSQRFGTVLKEHFSRPGRRGVFSENAWGRCRRRSKLSRHFAVERRNLEKICGGEANECTTPNEREGR